jgi:hypothetical protein
MAKLRPTPRWRAFWDDLHTEIRKGGGVVTSIPNNTPMFFECSIGSSLPEKLRGYGFAVSNAGTGERFDAEGHRVSTEIYALHMGMPK